MSYIIHLFNLRYPQETIESNLEMLGLEEDDSPLGDKERANQDRLIAQMSDVSREQKVFRHKTGAVINLAIEPDIRCGTQIELDRHHITVSIPYWYSGEMALPFFKEIWKYLRTLQQETGYLIYDIQLDKTLDLAVDFQDVYKRYTFLEQIRATN